MLSCRVRRGPELGGSAAGSQASASQARWGCGRVVEGAGCGADGEAEELRVGSSGRG